MADVLQMGREQTNSQKLREKAEADVRRTREIAADIRRMTKLYVEREQGRQRDA